jgi:hypothetical protein
MYLLGHDLWNLKIINAVFQTNCQRRSSINNFQFIHVCYSFHAAKFRLLEERTRERGKWKGRRVW